MILPTERTTNRHLCRWVSSLAHPPASVAPIDAFPCIGSGDESRMDPPSDQNLKARSLAISECISDYASTERQGAVNLRSAESRRELRWSHWQGLWPRRSCAEFAPDHAAYPCQSGCEEQQTGWLRRRCDDEIARDGRGVCPALVCFVQGLGGIQGIGSGCDGGVFKCAGVELR